MHTNDEFLRAIEADPRETTLRLAYSDWLNEHGEDDRAALIRVEEEMRVLPVFADRFWELKPRRNELRALAGAEWCGRMRYGTECSPVFAHGIPDGWRERWRLIREFTERWHRAPMPDIGGRQAEIAEAETRLGRALPPSVREYIAFVHDFDPRPWHVPRFVNWFFLEPLLGQQAISLLCDEIDNSLHCAIQFADFDQPDPFVVGFSQEVDDDGQPTDCVPLPPSPHFPPQTVALTVLNRLIVHLRRDQQRYYDVANPEVSHLELERQLGPRTQVGAWVLTEIDNFLLTFGVSVDKSRHTLSIACAQSPLPAETPKILADIWQQSGHIVQFGN